MLEFLEKNQKFLSSDYRNFAGKLLFNKKDRGFVNTLKPDSLWLKQLETPWREGYYNPESKRYQIVKVLKEIIKNVSEDQENTETILKELNNLKFWEKNILNRKEKQKEREKQKEEKKREELRQRLKEMEQEKKKEEEEDNGEDRIDEQWKEETEEN